MSLVKTATLTFHAPNNNGSFLQAYALQKVLAKRNVENIIINFYSKQQEKQYKVIRIPKTIGDCVRNVISLCHYQKLKRRYVNFQNMREKYLVMTKRIEKENEVFEEISKYDLMICGSDQIWNMKARDFSMVYFLPNISNKKISYAVSCGTSIKNMNDKALDNIKEFSAISVRENAIKKFFREKGIKNVKEVLDPTLLLEKEDYKELYKTKRILKKKYIFLYTINYDKNVLENAKRLSEKFDLPVYAAFTGYSAYRCKRYGIKVIYDMYPEKFLNFIENAEYVCSNSFHGIVFSIIFEKNFYRLCNVDDKDEIRVDDRIDGLLKKLKLMDINLRPNQVIEEIEIDYKEVNNLLKVLRMDSIEFLKKEIEEKIKKVVDK